MSMRDISELLEEDRKWLEEWDKKHPHIIEAIRREKLDEAYWGGYEEIWGYSYGRDWRYQEDQPEMVRLSWTDYVYYSRQDTRPLAEKVKNWEKKEPTDEVDQMLFWMWKKARMEENLSKRREKRRLEEDEAWLKWWNEVEADIRDENEYYENDEKVWKLGPHTVLKGEVLEPKDYFKGETNEPEYRSDVKWLHTRRHRIWVIFALFILVMCIVLGLYLYLP